jgi:rhombotail lipoprotein
MRRAAGLILLLSVVALVTSGCASVYERRKTVSLAMSPVAPAATSEEGVATQTKGIRIKTPMRIGLAFSPLPEKGGESRDIPSQLKQRLLEKVRNAFVGLSFVEAIEVVPTTYLKEGNEFESMVAASQAFNLDAMALITYDQEQFSDPSNWSLLYWTVIGVYLVPGEKSETRTLLEASVVAVDSRVLLLHASGSDKTMGWKTPIDVRPGLRQAAEDSFEKATDNLIADLRAQLDKAQTALKEERGLYGTPVAFVTEEGIVTGEVAEGRQGGGGGDLGWLGSGLFILLGLGCALAKRRDSR